jgi:transcriptional regulator with XRE-family HTH domain
MSGRSVRTRDALVRPPYRGAAARNGLGAARQEASDVDEDIAGRSVGERIRFYRERAGLSRPVLGGLVGRGAEWVKAVESGRLLAPRLPLLIRLAEVLEVADLADLTGEQRLSASSWTKAGHESLPAVSAALADYAVIGEDAPLSAAGLEAQVRQAWTLWHGSRRQRTAVAVVLPELITTARTGVRRLDGTERRRAAAALAQVYHLAQLYPSFQPVPALVLLTGDRAMTAAQDADDPHAMAVGAWYLNHVYRDAGQQHEARIALATQTATMLRPDEGGEDLARWGLLQLALALSYAKTGRSGDAWRHHDEADRAARALGAGYNHPWLIFGQGMVDAYAITMHADLMRPAATVAAADRLDVAAIPSATRRSFHLAETARAYSLRREPVATVHMLRRAYGESPDTARFSLFARSALGELRETGGTTIRGEAAALAESIGLPA